MLTIRDAFNLASVGNYFTEASRTFGGVYEHFTRQTRSRSLRKDFSKHLLSRNGSIPSNVCTLVGSQFVSLGLRTFMEPYVSRVSVWCEVTWIAALPHQSKMISGAASNEEVHFTSYEISLPLSLDAHVTIANFCVATYSAEENRDWQKYIHCSRIYAATFVRPNSDRAAAHTTRSRSAKLRRLLRRVSLRRCYVR